MKNIAIIGATGSTGKEVVRLALEANYKVSVVVRNPDQVQLPKNVTVIKGDVTNLESLVKSFENIEFVISCFGPASHRKVGNLMSVGASNIVTACEKNGVKRFVFMSGFVQSDYNELSFVTKLIMPIFRLVYNQSYNDKIIAEAAIKNSTLDWVIVRAVGLNNSQPTGQYKAGIKKRFTLSLCPMLTVLNVCLMLLKKRAGQDKLST